MFVRQTVHLYYKCSLYAPYTKVWVSMFSGLSVHTSARIRRSFIKGSLPCSCAYINLKLSTYVHCELLNMYAKLRF